MSTRQTRSTLRRNLRAEVFKALADESRLEVLMRLACATRPQTVSEITDCCGIHISGVSRHLATLREAGIGAAERSGREVRYRLDAEEVTTLLRDLADVIDTCRQNCCEEER